MPFLLSGRSAALVVNPHEKEESFYMNFSFSLQYF